MPLDFRLVHAARVVVEASCNLEVGENRSGHAGIGGVQKSDQLAQSLLEEVTADTELTEPGAHLLGVSAADLSHPQKRGRLLARNTGVSELARHPAGADLVDLIQPPQGGLHVGDAERLTHALNDLAVIDEHPHGRNRQVVERLGHHQRQVHLEVEG